MLDGHDPHTEQNFLLHHRHVKVQSSAETYQLSFHVIICTSHLGISSFFGKSLLFLFLFKVQSKISYSNR